MDAIAGAGGGFLSSAKNLGSNALDAVGKNLGNIEKAIIEIIDARPEDLKEESLEKPKGGKGKGVGGANVAPPQVTRTMTEADFNGLRDDIAGDSKFQGVNYTGGSVKQYVVQFNPSSLSIMGIGPGYSPMITYGAGENSVSTTGQEISINFNVRLILDQVDPFDAFMADKLNVSPTQLVQNVGKAIKTGVGKKKITVQEIAEGFTAALRNRYTRLINFHWGEMNYSGVLNGVTVTYVMFNQQGEPIRAYLDLSLRNAIKSTQPDDLGRWKEAYEAAFSSDLDTVRGVQKFGNLVNLGG